MLTASSSTQTCPEGDDRPYFAPSIIKNDVSLFSYGLKIGGDIRYTIHPVTTLGDRPHIPRGWCPYARVLIVHIVHIECFVRNSRYINRNRMSSSYVSVYTYCIDIKMTFYDIKIYTYIDSALLLLTQLWLCPSRPQLHTLFAVLAPCCAADHFTPLPQRGAGNHPYDNVTVSLKKSGF
jgi:hypothetical protein